MDVLNDNYNTTNTMVKQMLSNVQTEGGGGWSIDQLLYKTIPSKVIEIILLDYTTIRAILLLALILPLLYPLLHKILKSFSNAYNSFDLPKQVVVLHHTLEFAILACMMPIFSYYMIRVHFKVYSINESNSFLSDTRSTVILTLVIVVMYLNEITSRFMNPNPIVLFHHCVTVVDGILVLFYPTSVMFKTASILVYFTCFEAFCFAGLIMYRLYPTHIFTPKMILVGVIIFTISRPFQVLLVVGAIFFSWNDDNTVKWQATMQFAVALILTLIQVWSIKVHLCLRSKCIQLITNTKMNDESSVDQKNGAFVNVTDNKNGDNNPNSYDSNKDEMQYDLGISTETEEV